MNSLSAVFLGNGFCVCILVIMASTLRTVVLIDAKPLVLWRCIYEHSASSAVTHPVVSCSAEASGIPHSVYSQSFRVKVLRYLLWAMSVYALAITPDFSVVFLGQRICIYLWPQRSCVLNRRSTLLAWTLYDSRLLLMCVFRLAPAAGSQAAPSHQQSFCFLRARFSSTAHSSCCEMLHFSPRSQREACA